MSIRKLYFMSLSFAFLAVGLHLTAMSQMSRGVQIRAHAVTLSKPDRDSARVEASRHSSRGAVVGYVGFAFALASGGFVVLSARRQEPARRSVVLGLLVCYVMLQLILV